MDKILGTLTMLVMALAFIAAGGLHFVDLGETQAPLVSPRSDGDIQAPLQPGDDVQAPVQSGGDVQVPYHRADI